MVVDEDVTLVGSDVTLIDWDENRLISVSEIGNTTNYNKCVVDMLIFEG